MSGCGGGRLRACRRIRSSRTVAFLVQDLYFHNHDPWEGGLLPSQDTNPLLLRSYGYVPPPDLLDLSMDSTTGLQPFTSEAEA